MFHLLTNTSLFFDLGNDNFCQATGTPIYELKLLSSLPKQRAAVKRSIPQGHDEGKEGSKPKRREKDVGPKQYACFSIGSKPSDGE